MPHEIRGLVLTIINDADDFDKASDDWQSYLGASWQHSKMRMGIVTSGCQ